MAFGQYHHPVAPYPGAPVTPATSGYSDWFAVGGPFGSGGSGSNPENATGQVLPTYGGYAGGFADTMGLEGSLAKKAQNQKAASANFAQANRLQAAQDAYGGSEGQLASAMGKQASQYDLMAQGHGSSAADYGIPAQESSNFAAAQAAAAGGGNPLAARAAAAGLGAADTGVGAGYGSDVMGTMQAGTAGALGARTAMTSLYGAQGGQDIAAAQMAAQQAQFNPGLQMQQNKIGDLTALGYTNAGLGLQQNEQAQMNNAQMNANQYNLALQGLANQANNQITGAAASGAGAIMAAV